MYKTTRKRHTRRKKKNNTKKHRKHKQYKYMKPKSISKRARGKRSMFDITFLSDYDYNISQVLEQLSESGKHSIDPGLSRDFIENQISPARRQAARDLIENTIYITMDEIANVLEELILELYAKNNNFTDSPDIYLMTQNPSKSSYYLSVLALYFIRKHNLREPTRYVALARVSEELSDIINNNPLIYIDDMSYSGSQLSSFLDEAHGIRITQNKPPLNITCLLISASQRAIDRLVTVPDTKKNKTTIILDKIWRLPSPFNIIIKPERIYEELIYKLGYERYVNLRLFFSPWTSDTPQVLAYLDNKLADEVSTFKKALLYGPIIPNTYTLSIFKDHLKTPSKKGPSWPDFEFSFRITEMISKNTVLHNRNESKRIRLFENVTDKYPDLKTKLNINIKKPNEIIHKEQPIFEYILNKIIDNDIIDQEGPSDIRFIPFINTCNRTPKLLDIVNDPRVQKFDYGMFMIPKNCLISEGIAHDESVLPYDDDVYLAELDKILKKYKADECSVGIGETKLGDIIIYTGLKLFPDMSYSDFISNYINIMTSDPNVFINIHKKISDYQCPISWYKLKMTNLYIKGRNQTQKEHFNTELNEKLERKNMGFEDKEFIERINMGFEDK